MNVFEIKLTVELIKDIQMENLQFKIAAFIDRVLGKDEYLLEYHCSNKFKEYCFDLLFPLEMDKIYKKDKEYKLTLRTISGDLANFFFNELPKSESWEIKGIKAELKIIPKKSIERIYSITPAIVKSNEGYWRDTMDISQFERLLKENLIKKYNYVMDTKVEEDFELYTNLELKNRKPIASRYKGVRLLGDKISMDISNDKRAQELAYLSLGCGIFDMNARGYGFVNYK